MEEKMKQYDLIIIGGGPGGYVAALHAAKFSKSVVLFEQEELGGTCLNRGCIPTKSLLRSTKLYHEAKTGKEIGILADSLNYDLDRMHHGASETITTLREGICSLLQKAKVEVVNERAVIVDYKTVKAGLESYTAEKILIATGSRPALPPIQGIEGRDIHTSDYFLQNPVDCNSLVIIGGGVIGVEFAQIYNRLGCKVTIIEYLPRILPQLDREVGQSTSMIFKKRGIEILTGAKVLGFESGEKGVTCQYEQKGERLSVKADKVLICTGRIPNTENLIPEHMELEMERGFLPVTKEFQTKVNGIYAIGDVVLGGTQLAHAAEAQGANFATLAYGDREEKVMDYIPACVFVDPEIATVGLSLEDAKEKGIEVKSVKKLTSANGKSMIEGADRGFVKFIVETESTKVLGVILMCQHAGEMIGGITTLIKKGIIMSELEETIFPHPTVSETIIS